MNLQDYYFNAGEKPLDRIPQNGGFCGNFPHHCLCGG